MYVYVYKLKYKTFIYISVKLYFGLFETSIKFSTKTQ